MFRTENIPFYLLTVALVATASYVATKYKQAFTGEDDEYQLIRQYLLNDSPLYGKNRPKLWVHVPFELNARNWKSFGSRTSTDLNEPYLEVLIQSIIRQCASDFHICLIDDSTFSKLIPSWDIDLPNIAEPMRSRIRELGEAELLHLYGGIWLPCSFICMRNLKELYDSTHSGTPLVGEINTPYVSTSQYPFAPSMNIMCSRKGCPTMRELAKYLKTWCVANSHFESQSEFLGTASNWCKSAIQANKMVLISGDMLGVKTCKTKKPLLLEEWMEEADLDVAPNAWGIYVDNNEVLRRNRYNWLASISMDELYGKSNAVLVRYMRKYCAKLSVER
jgi:hypothetical protein